MTDGDAITKYIRLRIERLRAEELDETQAHRVQHIRGGLAELYAVLGAMKLEGKAEKLGELTKTPRGFECVEFYDSRDKPFELQQSSAIDDSDRGLRKPGSSFVLLGGSVARMHLDREQVKGLIARLECWLETGGFDGRD